MARPLRGVRRECIKEEGIDRFATLAESNFDPDYGLYRFKSASDVRAALR